MDLSTVMKASKALSSEIDIKKLLKSIIFITMENAGAQRGFLLLVKNNELFIETSGSVNEEIKLIESMPVAENNHLPQTIINYVKKTKSSVVLNDACNKGMFMKDQYVIKARPKSIICMPIIEAGNMAGILYLENNLTTNAFSKDRLEVIEILSAQAAISLNNANLVSIEKEKAVLEREVEMAQKIQQSLLPTQLPNINKANVAFNYEPIMAVGGDFINIYYDQVSKKLGFFICDVSGHGVPAALMASMISMSLDFFWKNYLDNPKIILEEMRNTLKGKMSGNFFTACICCLDTENQNLTFANAAHPNLIIVNKNNKNNEIRMIKSKGRLMTDFFEPNIENTTIEIDKGDIIILYTDGITEASNSKNEMLGTDDDFFCSWMLEIVKKSKDTNTLCEKIFEEVKKYAGTENLDDDMTVLAVEFTG